jgi:Ser/Thr protein kinase RdoA (MazF antagonist)
LNSKASHRYDTLIRREYLGDEEASLSFSKLPGHGINSENYKITFDDSGKKYVPIALKVLYKWEVNPADKLEIFDGCFEAGVKTAEIIKTKGGSYFVKEPDFIAICFRYYEAEEYGGSQEERGAAAKELGKLNNALSTYKKEFRRSKLYDFLTEDEFDTVKQACTDMGEFEKLVSGNIERLREFTERLSPKFNPDHYCYRLEHFDYYPENLLFKDGDVAAILDFDSIKSVPKHLSAAFACDRFSEKATGPEKISQMIEFIQAYKDTNTDLSAEEISKIPDLIQWEALKRVNYILRSHFFGRDNSWNKEIGHQMDIIKRTNEFEEDFLRVAEAEKL